MATVQELARAQAKGRRQLMLVDELLKFDLVSINVNVVTAVGGVQCTTTTYGDCELHYYNFDALKQRLEAAGFIIETKRSHKHILMLWPKTWEDDPDAAA